MTQKEKLTRLKTAFEAFGITCQLQVMSEKIQMLSLGRDCKLIASHDSLKIVFYDRTDYSSVGYVLKSPKEKSDVFPQPTSVSTSGEVLDPVDSSLSAESQDVTSNKNEEAD